LGESRRAGNHERIGLGSELRCECARPSCRGTVPAAAETQRGSSQRFVVIPAHFEAGVVVRAADRFFVVEPGRYAFVTSESAAIDGPTEVIVLGIDRAIRVLP
jgi:hypothetical protein